jgi:alkanesulfonate monooxygenase SsuD/methylene tetrahydromethanopterin reductase-like flavin-dependent oxidoreductase (luciferase family)
LPLGWADFIAQVDGAPIVDAYRRQFQPSDRCPEPRVLLCASAVAADTDDEAESLMAAVRAWRASGLRGPIPATPEGLTSRPVPIQPGRRSVAHGSPTRVADRLRKLVDGFGAEELMAVTICHDHEARVHSYELLAVEFGLPTSTMEETG